jgi:hypothetical protein
MGMGSMAGSPMGGGKGGSAQQGSQAPAPASSASTATAAAPTPAAQGSTQQQPFGAPPQGGKGGAFAGKGGQQQPGYYNQGISPYGQYQQYGGGIQQQNPMQQMNGYYTPIPMQMPQSPYMPQSSYQFGMSPIQSGQNFWGANPQGAVNQFNSANNGTATGTATGATTAGAPGSTTDWLNQTPSNLSTA